MASSGSSKFYLFVLLCLAVTIYLLWDKYSGKGRSEKEGTQETGVPNPPKAIFTLDEACYLLYADTNKLARYMYESNCNETQNLIYDCTPKLGSFNIGHHAYTNFYRHQNFYLISFSNKEDYYAFQGSFSKKENKGNTTKCVGGVFAISDQCYACDMDFQKKDKRYEIMIMKSNKENKPQKRSPIPKPESDDDIFAD